MTDEKIPDLIMFRILGEIEELPMLYYIDLVDFYDVGPKFKEVALQNIEPLKEGKTYEVFKTS